MNTFTEYRTRRVYETTPTKAGGATLRLSDRLIDLGPEELAAHAHFEAWQSSKRSESAAAAMGLQEAETARIIEAFVATGLVCRSSAENGTVTGKELHTRFSELLPTWLDEAFSHPFWERMMSGRGSARLFTGWLFELYHYTRNANRHMPLSCAHASEKPIKTLRAKHYAEEWNHYHYFAKSLRALGFDDAALQASVPLPASLAMSNFMRQAAREDVLAYSICSAVLEGTTTERATYNAYHDVCASHYAIPKAAIQPIYDHLNLDVQYQHADLFGEILGTVPELSRERATRVLDYGHMMVEHVWMWTDAIERYYGTIENPVPRRPFHPPIVDRSAS